METLGLLILHVVLSAVMTGTLLWVALNLIGEGTSYLILLLIGFIGGLFSLIPAVGGLISLIAVLQLLNSWTDVEPWPSGCLAVLIAQGLTLLILFIVVTA